MPDLSSYLVGYQFRVLWAECFPSDIPEVICSRLAIPVKIVPLREDQSIGLREYQVEATVQAESGERAVEILHRYFAHLPGCEVIRFAAESLDPARGEKRFSSDNNNGDLFKADPPEPMPMAGEGSGVPDWSVDLRFVVNERANDVGSIMERAGLIPFTVQEDRGGSCLVICTLNFDLTPSSGPEAEIVAWDMLGEKLQGVTWEKSGASVYLGAERLKA